MLRIPDRPLPDSAQVRLDDYQAEVDDLSSYEARVQAAKTLFKSRNRKDNSVFQAVRETLDGMCSGVRRCMYCEDSVADEVEHFKPKDFYPELVFRWDNYLYACGPCNSGKTNKFPIVSARSGEIVHLFRTHGDPITPPEPGEPALMHLRQEDPADFLRLDLRDTFYFEPAKAEATLIEHKRARQTIDTLTLNSRDYLCKARADAFEAYQDRLELYIRRRDAGEDPIKLQERFARVIRRMGHPTVWEEMKRQRDDFSELKSLFERAPEALTW